jgi:hypothetical protein
MTPSASTIFLPGQAAGDRGAGSRNNRDAVVVSKRCGKSGFAIATYSNGGIRPYTRSDLSKAVAILQRSATS